MKDKVLRYFKNHFGTPHIYVKSPGRANIIGEHTDYNHGLVFPFAIEQCIEMAIGYNNLGKLRLVALDIDEIAEIDITDLSFQTDGWTRYFINSLVALDTETNGIDVVFGGNLPQGGGVSSSSAITCGFLAGANTLLGTDKDLDELISLASQAENGIGLNGGIMDQTAILKGKSDQALMIDFLDFSVKPFPLLSGEHNFYLFNSGQKHNLVDTEYNKRRATCEAAVEHIKSKRPGVETMRDLSVDDLTLLDTHVARQRCQHVIEENRRVVRAAECLTEGNMEELGRLLSISHASLRDLYEVSTLEVDYLIQISNKQDNILGCRIMGGGFGGCTINLVRGSLTEETIQSIGAAYKEKTGYEMTVIKVKASTGVSVTTL